MSITGETEASTGSAISARLTELGVGPRTLAYLCSLDVGSLSAFDRNRLQSGPPSSNR